MAVLQLKNIHKAYGASIIFDDVTAAFSTEQKVGVIGRNGAGKSTLCRIILGEEEMDGGTIVKSSDLRLSYLPQQDPFEPGETVAEFLMRYSDREEWECGMMAAKFQLKHSLLYEKVKSLSGGYQTRIKLTGMLLKDPNFLILDEPSNYLDLNTLILLENFLQDYDGGFLIVSHDREFLKKTCEYTLEAENGDLTFYPGDVEEYLTFKEEQLSQAASINKNIEAKQKQLQKFIDRFGAKASKATQAKSKLKQLHRLSKDKIEIQHTASTVRIRIPSVERTNGVALRTKDLVIGYPGKTVAQGIHVEGERGSHIAVLGENGQGKTTFLRTLAGDLPALGGEYRWGNNLKTAYYAQHVFSSLHPKHSVYSHLESVAASDVSRQDILNIAGSFLFKGDEVNKSVSVLSGGERARLCLAGLLLTKSPILLLDEPTNHLDFETVEALARALKEFAGTIFFISHDRTFVNLLATEIFDVKNGSIKRYPGTYEEYVYFLEKQAQEDPDAEDEKPEPPKEAAPKASLKDLTKELKAEIARIKKEIQEAEEKVATHKTEKESILQDFIQSPAAYSRERETRLKEVAGLLEKEEALWLELQAKLEKLTIELNSLSARS